MLDTAAIIQSRLHCCIPVPPTQSISLCVCVCVCVWPLGVGLYLCVAQCESRGTGRSCGQLTESQDIKINKLGGHSRGIPKQLTSAV